MPFSDTFRRAFDVQHGGTSTIPAMEGLRGVAVFGVFLVHYFSLMEPWLSTSSPTFVLGFYMHNVGMAGVDLFFVLSGYLIYRMLLTKPTPFVHYLTRRARRIYPAFLIVLAVYVVLAVFFFPGERALPSAWWPLTIYIAENVLLLPGLFPIQPIMSVAWSLSYEAFYYVMVPAAIGLLALRAWTPRARVALVMLITVAGFTYCHMYGGQIRLLMFLAGILVFELTTAQVIPTTRGFGLVCLLAGLVGMVLVKAERSSDWWRFVVLYGSFLGLCLDALGRAGLTARAFSSVSLRAFGNMSYSYYLIHGLTLKFAVLVLSKIWLPTASDSWLFWVLLAPMFVATLVPSILLFVYVEKPYSLSHRGVSAAQRPRFVGALGKAIPAEAV